VNFGARFARGKLGIDGVVSEFQARAVGFRADSAERLEQFEQANVVAAGTLDDWEGVGGYGREDRDLFVIGRESSGQKRYNGQ
jgi:hypothetical protein